jgi:hypothetical protein
MSDNPRHPWPLPRVLRFRDAPLYLGMDRNRFNAEVRPYFTELSIGTQGIGFDRLELDAWFEDYKSRNGRPARKGETPWDANKSPASSCGPGSGISTSAPSGGEFARVLAQINSKKPNGTLQPRVQKRCKDGMSPGTINHGLKIVRRMILPMNGLMTWLLSAPRIKPLPDNHKKPPIHLTGNRELPNYLEQMALFAANTWLSRRRDLQPAMGVGGRGSAIGNFGLHSPWLAE